MRDRRDNRVNAGSVGKYLDTERLLFVTAIVYCERDYDMRRLIDARERPAILSKVEKRY